MKRLGQTIRDLWKDPMGRIGMIGILLVILVAIFAPLAAPFEPDKMVAMPKSAPSADYWFGTDNYGRDIFSRILYGARVSLEVGIIAVGIGAVAGYILGLLAGYFEGWVDRVIMCVMDILFAFPSILLAIFISAVLGRGLVNTMIAIGIVNIPVFARTVRAAVISAKGLEYVSNARSVGVRTGAILVRHISPNVVAPFTVQATLALSSAILTEASMSFLGLGIQPPDPSWGSMLSEARTFMEQAPWMAIFPALFIIVTILLFNILGDSLRDVLDPKLKT
ncbi:ABC transporter permease [Pseudoflavonifractor sp. DSM 107456]|uniref:ABC transporter permease n=2 Tax=Pseudoflavonifractor TaxID=1017280 RepID=A0ABR9RB08_9FIRM|nr:MULTISPECIES: ABC transporter permease [Eubacteriales]MBC5729296.1 ABC transporter permease [Pseudoflavonifractor hominis]MBE5055882.1 ABC transporter permease [Pseudoflavonifractor gallinarum]